MIYDQPRLTSPLLEAQQKLLQSLTPVRYQPLLTPDNYLNFYGTQQGVAPSATDLLYPRIQRTAAAPAPAGGGSAYVPAYTGGDSGSSGQPGPSPWDSMTDAQKAAYYRENPTMGSITRAINTGMQYTLPGAVAGYFDPGTFVRNDAIAAGIDPTGWQFSTRANDGIFGTQIGGSLVGPDLSPENLGYGMPGTETANQYVPSLFDVVAPEVPGGQTRSISGGAPVVRDYVAEAAAQRAADEAAAAQAAAAQAAAAQASSSNQFVSQPYYQTQDTSSYSDYAGAGQTQMDRSLSAQSDYYG